jgi:hypothetical protein
MMQNGSCSIVDQRFLYEKEFEEGEGESARDRERGFENRRLTNGTSTSRRCLVVNSGTYPFVVSSGTDPFSDGKSFDVCGLFLVFYS